MQQNNRFTNPGHFFEGQDQRRAISTNDDMHLPTHEYELTDKQTNGSGSVSSSKLSYSVGTYSVGTARAREAIEAEKTAVINSSHCCDEIITSRAKLMHGWYKECCEYFAENYLRPPAPVARRDLATIIKNGMTADCLKAIMDESQKAPRPSWSYAKAIAKRCEAYGIRTLEDWVKDQAKRKASRNPALNYQQREYSDEDFGPDFFVDLNQYGQGGEERHE